MSSLKQRKGAAAASASTSSSSSSGGALLVEPAAVAVGASSSAAGLRSTSAYDHIPGRGSARDIAASKLASTRGSGFLAGFSGGSEFVFQAILLLAICVLAFMVRLFSVVRYESVIHEFDPWFNFRTTRYLVEEGFYAFHNCQPWNRQGQTNRSTGGPGFDCISCHFLTPSTLFIVHFCSYFPLGFDDATWYPLGRFIGGTVYPGLMYTAGILYHLLHLLHFTVDIRNVCVMLAPFMASQTCIATYLLTKEVWNGSAGVFAAAFIAIAPGQSQQIETHGVSCCFAESPANDRVEGVLALFACGSSLAHPPFSVRVDCRHCPLSYRRQATFLVPLPARTITRPSRSSPSSSVSICG